MLPTCREPAKPLLRPCHGEHPAWAQELATRVPRDFELLGQRKGFKRFMSPALRRGVVSRQAALDAREAALSGSLQVEVSRDAALQRLCCGPCNSKCISSAGEASAVAVMKQRMCSPTCMHLRPDSVCWYDLQAMLRLFSEQHALWHRAVAAVAHLDALMSLAAAAAFADGSMCRPQFIKPGMTRRIATLLGVGHCSSFLPCR